MNRVKRWLRSQSGSQPGRQSGGQADASQRAVFQSPGTVQWYPPVMLNPMTVGSLAMQPEILRQVMQVVSQLAPDDYLKYLADYYSAGLSRFGEAWRYADILTVLQAAANLLRPQHYLEIGVRRGRSMAVVAAASTQAEIVGFDLWVEGYAGMSNPGPELVRSEMKKVGHVGNLELISGDSHRTLPEYFRTHPEAFFDLVTVDGDHSSQGTAQDLKDALPRLKVGGVLVFDDIHHPKLPDLQGVWQRLLVSNHRLATWEYDELGYGVGLAVRKEV